MADSTDSAAAAAEPGRLLPCAYCPDLGADVCVRITPSTSGAGHSVYAHRRCAEARGIPVLYALTPAAPERAS